MGGDAPQLDTHSVPTIGLDLAALDVDTAVGPDFLAHDVGQAEHDSFLVVHVLLVLGDKLNSPLVTINVVIEEATGDVFGDGFMAALDGAGDAGSVIVTEGRTVVVAVLAAGVVGVVARHLDAVLLAATVYADAERAEPSEFIDHEIVLAVSLVLLESSQAQ